MDNGMTLPAEDNGVTLGSVSTRTYSTITFRAPNQSGTGKRRSQTAVVPVFMELRHGTS